MFGNHNKIWTPLHLYNQSLLQTSDVPDMVLFFHWVRIVSILCSKEQQSQECSVKESFLIKCIWEMYIPYLEIRTKGSEEFCRKKLCLILMNTIVLKLIWSPIPFLAVGEAQISDVIILGRCCHIRKCVIGKAAVFLLMVKTLFKPFLTIEV